MNVLELFAGSRSVGYECINLAKDIEHLSIYEVPFIPDAVWASPDCTTYSIAAISTHRNGIEPKTEYAKKCDAVNQHVLGLINQWLCINPKMIFYIENPRGMLRKMPWMQGFIRHTIWYCQYGERSMIPEQLCIEVLKSV